MIPDIYNDSLVTDIPPTDILLFRIFMRLGLLDVPLVRV